MKHPTLKVFAILLIGSVAVGYGLRSAGNYLVVSHPERSEVIVVLAGDHNDHRYWGGLELLHEGYGQRMLVDAAGDKLYGRSYAEYASDFVAQSAGDKASEVGICTIKNDSTVQESSDVRRCLAQIHPAPQSVLLVTNDYHTHRALLIFNNRLPQYHWSVVAVSDTALYGEPWWHHREWAKIYIYEWEKLVWWKCYESWHH